MKKFFFSLSLILLILLSMPVKAQDKGFGAGIMVGQPTGLSGKYWLNQVNALDFGLGFSFAKDDSRIHIHADYLWHSNTSIESSEKFSFYYGPGIKLRSGKNDDAQLGIRGVIGIEWMAAKIPIDVFLEIAPVFNFVPGTSFKVDASFGARYYFE